MKRRAGPAVDDVQQHAAAAGRGAGRPAEPGARVLEYHDTAVGRLPRGPAADAALAAAALSAPAPAARPAPPRRPPEAPAPETAARGAGVARLVPVLVAAALAAAIAILAWRRSTA